MTHRTLSTAWFVVFASLTAPSYAAEPEFKAGLVTESRTYGRWSHPVPNPRSGQIETEAAWWQIHRVMVALEGERITAEWTAGTPAKDFPLDSDVQVAIRGNQLLLIDPNPQCTHMRLSAAPCRKWSIGWMRASIVDRVKSDEDESD